MYKHCFTVSLVLIVVFGCVRGQTGTELCSVLECTFDPCTGARCPKHPTALCYIANYCGIGCFAEFSLHNGTDVTHDCSVTPPDAVRSYTQEWIEGATGTIPCDNFGPDVYWKRPDGSRLVPGQTSGRFSVSSTGTLEAHAAQKSDEGIYTCYTGGSPEGVPRVNVTIQTTHLCSVLECPFDPCTEARCPKHPRALCYIANYCGIGCVAEFSLHNGTDVTSDCSDTPPDAVRSYTREWIEGVTGTIPCDNFGPDVYWKRPDGSRLVPGQTSGRFSVSAVGTLEAEAAQKSDEGIYTCYTAGSPDGVPRVNVTIQTTHYCSVLDCPFDPCNRARCPNHPGALCYIAHYCGRGCFAEFSLRNGTDVTSDC